MSKQTINEDGSITVHGRKLSYDNKLCPTGRFIKDKGIDMFATYTVTISADKKKIVWEAENKNDRKRCK